MKPVAAIGVILGVIALILAAMAFKVAAKNDADIKALRTESAAMKASCEMPRGSSQEGSSSKDVAQLKAQFSQLSEQLASLAAAPKASAAGAAIGEDRVREIVREEAQAAQAAMRARFQAGGAGGGGAAPAGGGGAPADYAQRLRDRAGLDEQKAAQVAPIVQKAAEEIGNIFRENRGGGRDQNVALVQEQRQKAEDEIAKILTPEEMDKFKAGEIWGRQRGGNRGGRGGAPGGAQPPAQP